jgi:iron complex outermembrane receptor protein
MKTSSAQRRDVPSSQRKLFKLGPVAAGCAVMLLVSASAQAQQAAPAAAPATASLSTVVITGIRKGIEDAISVKKDSDSIVEAISAEDIGKLPDATVAESIARLPGVTAQRDMRTGKASTISIRGMSPDFNGALLNGREQASTGDSRAPSFDVYPAELMNSIVVYKTPDALLVGQGLSSTTDLRTLKPLDFAGRTMAANLKKKTTGIGSGAPEKGDGNSGSFSYVDQFADRTIGLALGVTRTRDSNNQQVKFDSWGGWAADWDNPATGTKVKVPGGFKADVETTGQDRDAVLAVLQFAPSSSFKTTVDVLSSKGKGSYRRTGLEGAVAGNAGDYDPDGVLSNATVVGGVATAGTINNYKGVVRNHMTTYDDSLVSIGLNSALKTGAWTSTLDLANSKATRDEQRYETTAGQPGDYKNNPAGLPTLGSISWTGFNGSNFESVQYKTSVNYADRSKIALTDINGWGGTDNGVRFAQAGYLARPSETDTVNNFRLTESRDLEWGPLVAVKFGVNVAKREKKHSAEEFTLQIKGQGALGSVAIPGTTTMTTANGVPIATFDPAGTEGSIYNLVNKVDGGIVEKQWGVTEDVTTTFIKGDIDSSVMGMPLRGNIGTQFVSTKQTSSGVTYNPSNCFKTAASCPTNTVKFGTSYTDVLPSLNLALSLPNDQVLRFATAKVMARPSMADMKATGGFNLSQSGDDAANPVLRGGGGNPYLEPFRANAYDISFEKYFGKKGVISVAAFYKKLDSYILSVGRQIDFAPYLTASSSLATTGANKGSTKGIWTSKINGTGGKIQGYEINFDLPFSLATSALDGFGLQMNFSDTSSNVRLPSSSVDGKDLGASIPLPGLSKTVNNLKLYYEANGFQIGVAQKTRSSFIGEITDFEDSKRTTWVKGESILDLQLAYEFRSGYFKGLSLTMSANNVSDAKFQRMTVDDKTGEEKIVDSVRYGKTYNFGLNYKF